MHRHDFTSALAKIIGVLALVLWIPTAKAIDYAVTVSRDAQDYYVGKIGYQGVVQTQFCFEFVFFDNATLRLTTPSTGSLIFSSGQQCSVLNVFDPATVAAGNYAVNVNSAGDGYYELTDHSYLIKAMGFDFAFGSSATLSVTSAINGLAFGTIKLASSSFSQPLENIYSGRLSGGGGGGAPNLTISAFSASPTNVSAGGTVNLAATIRNAGTASSAATTLHYYEWLGSTWSEMTFCRDSVGSLAPGATSSQSCAIIPPSAPGTYDYNVAVDTVSGESVTTDNAGAYVSVSVSGGGGAPNLTISAFSASPTNVSAGGTVNLAATIRNAGTASSAATTLHYYEWLGSTWSEMTFCRDSVGSLAPGATSSQSCAITPPSAPGTYDYYVAVDTVSGESVTTDNAGAYVSVSVNGGTGNNYQGLWWKAPAGSESGWGVNFAHQGDSVFATWYTYDASGKPWWLSMLASRTAPTSNAYSGLIYVDTGPPFNDFVGAGTPAQVGSGTVTFTDGNNGSFLYTVNGTTQTKAIARYDLGTGPQPACTYGVAPNFAAATNYQDLWWVAGGAESGWGVNFTHQGNSVFATWYTYDAGGAPLWLSVLATRVGTSNVYTGTLYRSWGPRFDAYDTTKWLSAQVGTATFTFADGNHATFAYMTNGTGGLPAATQSKQVTRYLFAAPAGTVCN